MNKLLIIMALSLFSLTSNAQSNGFVSLTVEQFAKFIQDDNVQRLDVRTEEEYAESHIPESINIDVKLDDFAAKSDSLLDINKPVALYCRSGKRSKTAAAILVDKGFKVYELDDGILSWINAAKPVTQASRMID